MALTFVTRSQWRARNPSHVNTIPIPTPDLWLHHTGGAERGSEGMRAIQDYHMDVKGWSDIAYSFVIDPISNWVYVGRGAGIQGAHTEGHNTTSHAICIMGNFEVMKPSDDLLRTIAELINYGVEKGWWSKFTGGHRDASGASTACPGKYLYAAIPTIKEYTLNGDDVVTEEQMQQIGDWIQEQRAIGVKEILDELNSTGRGSIKRKLNRLLDKAGLKADE